MGHRFVPTSTILRRMAQRDQRIARMSVGVRALAVKRRYCPMCDVWLPVRETTCRACGQPTEPAAEGAELPKPERVE
jgi:predicted amidophosphoribosyltransferase